MTIWRSRQVKIIFISVSSTKKHTRGEKGRRGWWGGSQVPFSNPNFVQILESHSTFASNPIPSGKDAWSNPSIACVQMFPWATKEVGDVCNYTDINNQTPLYRHPLNTNSLLCPWGDKALTFSLNSTQYQGRPVNKDTFYGPFSVRFNGFDCACTKILFSSNLKTRQLPIPILRPSTTSYP